MNYYQEDWRKEMIIDSSKIVLESSYTLVQRYEKSEIFTASVKSIGSGEKQSHKPSCDKVSISEKALKHLEKYLDKAIVRLNKKIINALAHQGRGLNKALKHLQKDLDKAIRNLDKNINKALNHNGKGIEKALKHLQKDLDKAVEHLNENLDSEKTRKVKIGRHEATSAGLAKRLVEDFTGTKVKMKDLNELFKDYDNHNDDDKKIKSGEHRPKMQAWNIAYNSHESYYENEQMSFNAGGVVRTADGREINFSLDLMMSREFISETNISAAVAGVGAGNIVVDFEGPASELSNSKFAFKSGSEEDNEVTTYLAIGNGKLTLDLNNDGQINGDNEIVGASTGNGFAELAAHDEDSNGWIDENDSVYEQLSVYSKDTEGNESVSGLMDSNVGAIHLGSVDTQFTLIDSKIQQVGQIEKTGVYLNEDGTTGIVQQISVMV